MGQSERVALVGLCIQQYYRTNQTHDDIDIASMVKIMSGTCFATIIAPISYIQLHARHTRVNATVNERLGSFSM